MESLSRALTTRNDYLSVETVEISNVDVLRFALSIGIDDDSYLASLRDPYMKGQIAPLTFYIALAMTSKYLVPRDSLGTDGLPVPEHGRAYRVTAGDTQVEVYHRMAVGDIVTITERNLSEEPKRGKSGSFLIQTLERRYHRADGELMTLERYSRILRPDVGR